MQAICSASAVSIQRGLRPGAMPWRASTLLIRAIGAYTVPSSPISFALSVPAYLVSHMRHQVRKNSSFPVTAPSTSEAAICRWAVYVAGHRSRRDGFPSYSPQKRTAYGLACGESAWSGEDSNLRKTPISGFAPVCRRSGNQKNRPWGGSSRTICGWTTSGSSSRCSEKPGWVNQRQVRRFHEAVETQAPSWIQP